MVNRAAWATYIVMLGVAFAIACSKDSSPVPPTGPTPEASVVGKYVLTTVTGASIHAPFGNPPNGYYRYPSGYMELRSDSSFTETLAVEWLSALSDKVAGFDTLTITGKSSIRSDSAYFSTADGNYLFTASIINGWVDYVDEGVRVNYHK